jgi:hypothetical protein
VHGFAIEATRVVWLRSPVPARQTFGWCQSAFGSPVVGSAGRRTCRVACPCYGVVVDMSMSAGINSGSPVVSTKVPKTTVGSSPAPRAVWTTSSS